MRNLDFSRWFNGSGVLHTKLWIIDRKHFYVGSANMDWRSLTQVCLKLIQMQQYPTDVILLLLFLFLGERIWSACNELRMFSGRRFQDIFSLLESCRTNVRSDALAQRSEDHLQQGHAHAFACKQHQCDRLHLGKQTPLSRGSFHCDVATLITIVTQH